MKLLITGASGFLGEHVVTEALRCGHQVRALVRPSVNLEEKLTCLTRVNDFSPQERLCREKLNPPGISQATTCNLDIAIVDLTSGDGLAAALQGIDAVIHLAAAMTGDYSTQFANTVTATNNLLTAMELAGIARLVAISSFSVYDYLHQPEGALLDENAPLEHCSDNRDAYAKTKLQQEQLVHEYQSRCGGAVTVLRPGIIFGRGVLWPAHLGVKLKGNLVLQIGGSARLPLTYVENCAEAVVQALDSKDAIGQVVNVVDDERPTQQEFIGCLRQHRTQSITTHSPLPTTITMSWTLARYIARCVWSVNRLLGQRIPLPGILIPARLHARFKPLDYSNYAAKTLLHWTPRYPLPEAIARSLLDLNCHNLPASESLSNHSSISSSPIPESVTITAS